MSDEAVQRRLVVRGRVQGVGFRYGVVRRAEQAGLAGWVRNRPDGTVEAVFEGDRDGVERLVAWFRLGPRGAHVEDVTVVDEAPDGAHAFEIR